MTETTTGSCQCGGVKFEIAGAFERFFLCHCKRCRKDTGAANAANLFSSGKLIWLSGEELVRTYHIPDTRHRKSFCGNCGAALPRIEPSTGGLVVPAGSLDTPVTLRPDAHICVADSAEWDRDLEEVPRLQGLPG